MFSRKYQKQAFSEMNKRSTILAGIVKTNVDSIQYAHYYCSSFLSSNLMAAVTGKETARRHQPHHASVLVNKAVFDSGKFSLSEKPMAVSAVSSSHFSF